MFEFLSGNDSPGVERVGDHSKFGVARTAPVKGEVRIGEIVRITDEAVFVDIGLERPAVVPKKDLADLDAERLESLAAGVLAPVFIDYVPADEGEVLVSLARGWMSEDWARAGELLDRGESVELEVIGQREDGLEVAFGSLTGFAPRAHLVSYSPAEDDALESTQVGGTMLLKPIEVNPIRNRLIFAEATTSSGQPLSTFERLEVGQAAIGKVVKVTNYGAFIDLGGAQGLLHVSELDWYRVRHPAEILKKGEECAVQIIAIDREKGKISLSRKSLLPDPWEQIETTYQVGEVVIGVVSSVTKFGAFIRLPARVEGLLHVSEMGENERPRKDYQRNQEVLVKILRIDVDRRRIALGLSRPEDIQAT